MLKNTNHDIMPSAEKSAYLAGRVMVIDGQTALVGIKPTDSASVVLGDQCFRVPLGRDAVVSLKLFAPLDLAILRRALVALDDFATSLGQTIGALVGRVFGTQGRFLLKRSHIVLLPDGLRLSTQNPIGA